MVVSRDLDKRHFDKNSIITVGTFDGVHLGHRKIIQSLTDIALENSLRKVVVTFEPHPRIVLSDNNAGIKILTSTNEKINLLESLGVDILYIINFTKNFASTSADDFYKNILIDSIGLSHLVIGYDHMFGKNREGSIVTIKLLSEKYNFKYHRVEEFRYKDEIVSSSAIRKLLMVNDIEKANEFLGDAYSLEGLVIQGDKRGNQIGFPTANLQLNEPHKLIPSRGVYYVKVEYDGKVYDGMMNIGYRPTVRLENELFLEVNIFDFNQNIYGKVIKVKFLKYLRDEIKFSSIEELVAQLKKDKETSIEISKKYNK